MTSNIKQPTNAKDLALRKPSEDRAQRDGSPDPDLKFELRSIGVGTMRTSSTYAALLIQLEGDRWEQIDVLDSVMEALGILPEEVLLNRQRPDCIDEEPYSRWRDAMDDLEKRARSNHQRDTN